MIFNAVIAGLAVYLLIGLLSKKKVNPTTGYVEEEFLGFNLPSMFSEPE